MAEKKWQATQKAERILKRGIETDEQYDEPSNFRPRTTFCYVNERTSKKRKPMKKAEEEARHNKRYKSFKRKLYEFQRNSKRKIVHKMNKL